MAAQFFNGVMGSFSSYNHLASVGIPASGMPPMGSYGGAGGYGAAGAAGARGANGAPASSTGGSEQGRTNTPPPVQQYLPQTNASVNKDEIKSTSAFGNARASEGFATHEVTQTDKTVKDQAVKLSLMIVSGALVWTSGGVQEAQAQVCARSCGQPIWLSD